MKLEEIIITGFRRYRDEIRIPMGSLTALIGRNDIGKSSVLEAIDAFFNGKIDVGDGCIGASDRTAKIGCVFSEFPSEIDLDRGARTSLASEYLLNASGKLEVYKTWDLNGSTAKKPNVFIRAVAPTNEQAVGLLSKKQSALQSLVKALNIEPKPNLAQNPAMRASILTHLAAIGQLELAETDIPLGSGEDAKFIWENIEKILPMYFLFKSDRQSSDQDKEVQDPLNASIRRAMSDISDKLEEVSRHVEGIVQETANRTLVHLRSNYPELADNLTPKFRKPDWDKVFKLDLSSDDDVPLNKRGSGVRRLVLLSFFQAEAERKRIEKAAGGSATHNVIYAVEEPETSQHPDNQKMIIEALKSIARAGEQVILTTHVPGLAGLVPVDGIRFVDTSEDGRPRARIGSSEVLIEVAETLGVMPTAIRVPPTNDNAPRVAVCVEGHTDESAFQSLTEVLRRGSILPVGFDEARIFWVAAGGSGLHAWVERRYLDALGIPQIYIMDSDKESAAHPVKPATQTLADELTARTGCTVFVLRKREMENYLHTAAIARATGNAVNFAAVVKDCDYCDMAKEFDNHVIFRVRNREFEFWPVDQFGSALAMRKSNAKEMMCAHVMRQMSIEELEERAVYSADDGTVAHEILEIFGAIAAFTR